METNVEPSISDVAIPREEPVSEFVYSLKGKHEAIFWNHMPQRRCSISRLEGLPDTIANADEGQNGRRDSVQSVNRRSSDTTSQHRDYRDYNPEDILVYELRGGKKIFFLKDFRHARTRERSISVTFLPSAFYGFLTIIV